MPRCRSWRPVENTTRPGPFADPGQDRTQWRRCRNKIPRGQVRCTECFDLLASHPNEKVRALLAGEQALPEDVLVFLLEDASAVVATAASDALLADYPDSPHLGTPVTRTFGGTDTW